MIIKLDIGEELSDYTGNEINEVLLDMLEDTGIDIVELNGSYSYSVIVEVAINEWYFKSNENESKN